MTLELPAKQPEMTAPEQLAKEYVDQLVIEDELDTGAMVHRKIEQLAASVITDERTLGHVNVNLPLLAQTFATSVVEQSTLDVGAVMHSKMEKRFLALLKADQNAFAKASGQA